MIQILGIILIVWGAMAMFLTGINFLVLWSYGVNFLLKLPFKFLYSLMLIICGIGLTRYKNWARLTVLIVIVPLFVLVLPYQQLGFLKYFNTSANPKLILMAVFEIIRLVFGCLLLYFLMLARNKELFKQKSSS